MNARRKKYGHVPRAVGVLPIDFGEGASDGEILAAVQHGGLGAGNLGDLETPTNSSHGNPVAGRHGYPGLGSTGPYRRREGRGR